MLTPVNIEDFGGLDLRSDPEESACVDATNISFHGEGQIASRPGYSTFATVGTDTNILGHSLNSILAFSLTDDKVRSYSAAGALLATSAATFGLQLNFAQFGGTSGNYTYYGGGTTPARITRYNPSGPTFTDITTTPSSGYLAVSPIDNRLVIADAYTSKVYFSDAGVPETFGANNYVQLDPGDGESFTGVQTWRDLTFVFKQSKFFVFYGTSTSSTGTPVFNYRAVRSTVGIDQQGACVSGPDGVYFLSRDGVFRTTGGSPERVSRQLDPLFGYGSLAAAAVPAYRPDMTGRQVQMAWHDGRLFVPIANPATGLISGTLVWHRASDKWALWSLSSAALVATGSLPAGFDRQLFASPISGTTIVTFGDETDTTDAGTAIVSSYRSGFSDLGSPGVEKTVRETELTGIGAPKFAWSRDFGALDTASAVTLGTSPATARGRHRVAKRGSVLSWQASATSGAWRLNRVVPMLRDVRDAGSKTS